MDRFLCAWLPSLALDNWNRRNASASPAEIALPPWERAQDEAARRPSRPDVAERHTTYLDKVRAAFTAKAASATRAVGHPAPADTATGKEGLVLVVQERGVRRVFALNPAAAGHGLFVGQKAADAQALVPEARYADADPEGDARAIGKLAHWAERFSPAVAVEGADTLILDVTGLAHLWGGEEALIADLAGRLGALGFTARCAAAGTAGAAWALAHFAEPGAIVPPGGEAKALFPLPITALRLEPEAAAQIARLGLVTVGRLAVLPSAALTRRFGPQVGLRLNQALGRTKEALHFRRPPTPWLARLKLAEPISTPDDLARVTADIASLLCARLEKEGKGVRRLELAFHRLDGQAPRLAIGLALPGRDPKAMARLFGPKLETVDPGFGIEAVTLAARGVQALSPAQAALDQAGTPATEDGVGALVDRLANRLGEGEVWRPEPRESHAPERAVARRPPLAPAAPGRWRQDHPRPLRLFRRPEPVEAVAQIPDAPPVAFTWRGVRRRVRLAEGPERLAEEWWRVPFDPDADPRVRDYYRVEDETGARFWLFRDGLYGQQEPPKWWLHGFFG